ncbi:MAG: hypothetical protein ABJA87_09060 [bacterium]
MSPTEEDLRRALREGETSSRSDVDRLVRTVRDHAFSKRVARRRRWTTAAGVAAAVLVAGAGVTLAERQGGSGAASSAQRDTAAGPATQQAAGGVDSPGPAAIPSSGVPAACPTTAPRLVPALPKPDEPVLPAETVAVRVCLFPVDASAGSTVVERLLSHTRSIALTTAVNAEPPSSAIIKCASRPAYTVVLLPATAAGPGPAAVAAAQDCYLLSNGRTNRAAGTELLRLLGELTKR